MKQQITHNKIKMKMIIKMKQKTCNDITII